MRFLAYWGSAVITPILKENLGKSCLDIRRKERTLQVKEEEREVIRLEVIKEAEKTPYKSIQELARLFKKRYQFIRNILEGHLKEDGYREREKICRSYSKIGSLSPMKGKMGKYHHNYKGLIQDGKGYFQRLRPDWCTEEGKYIFEHRLVMMQALGLTQLPQEFDVHHIDQDKSNNLLENLALVSKTAHQRIHQFYPISEKLTMWELNEFMIWKLRKSTLT